MIWASALLWNQLTMKSGTGMSQNSGTSPVLHANPDRTYRAKDSRATSPPEEYCRYASWLAPRICKQMKLSLRFGLPFTYLPGGNNKNEQALHAP